VGGTTLEKTTLEAVLASVAYVNTDLIIGLVLIGAMIVYAVGAVMNNGSDALLGCLIPFVGIVGVFLGVFLLSGGWVLVVDWVIELFS
jgi:hypothetical protein